MIVHVHGVVTGAQAIDILLYEPVIGIRPLLPWWPDDSILVPLRFPQLVVFQILQRRIDVIRELADAVGFEQRIGLVHELPILAILRLTQKFIVHHVDLVLDGVVLVAVVLLLILLDLILQLAVESLDYFVEGVELVDLAFQLDELEFELFLFQVVLVQLLLQVGFTL